MHKQGNNHNAFITILQVHILLMGEWVPYVYKCPKIGLEFVTIRTVDSYSLTKVTLVKTNFKGINMEWKFYHHENVH